MKTETSPRSAQVRFSGISRAEYVARARTKAKKGLSQDALEERVSALLSVLDTKEREVRVREIAESFLVDVEQGYEGILLIVPLSSVKKVLEADSFKAANWHYDRTAGVMLVNMNRGRHEHLSGVLHQLYVGTDPQIESAAEKFIDEGLGWFKSSASFGRMLKGENVKMNAQERTAFSSVASFD